MVTTTNLSKKLNCRKFPNIVEWEISKLKHIIGITGLEIIITGDGEPAGAADVTLKCVDPPEVEVFTAVEQGDGKYRFEDAISGADDLECELIVEKDG